MVAFLFLSVFGASVFQFDDNAFTQHIRRGNKSIPWFVMFGGANCPACTVAYPEFESASSRARGFAYADRSVAPNTAESLSIRAIPAFWVFPESGDRLFTSSMPSSSITSSSRPEIRALL
jgi:thioredoxin-like negative regulator of GroEL